jgi:hypothetical protein
MHERYDYLTSTETTPAPAGAVLVGEWSGVGGIGWHDDERITLIGWPDGVTPAPLGGSEPLRATVRPTAISQWQPGGVFAHRWFEFDPADWEEFVTLSSEAWPAFESAYGATIEAFLRGENDPGKVLLITRYPSMAAWEESRGVLRQDVDAGKKFLRRRQLTTRSIVRTARLIEPAR